MTVMVSLRCWCKKLQNLIQLASEIGAEVKTGMLATSEIVKAVAASLKAPLKSCFFVESA